MFEPTALSVVEESGPIAGSRATPRIAHHAARITLAELARVLGTELDVGRLVADVGFPVRRLAPGDTLYRAGDRFDAIYVLRSGFCKTVAYDSSGAEVVLSFPMSGDVVGLDGVDEGAYTADVVAIDMCSVAIVPFAQLARLGRENPGVDQLLYSIFSRELVCQRKMLQLLGTLTAEARLATFLLDLAERFGRLGYSRTSFALRMTRAEIGSYLGLKLETVSRTFSALAAAGILAVQRRQIELRDARALLALAAPASARAR